MLAFDRAWRKKQHAAGWAGLAWPKAYGGRGLSLIEQLIWFEEYAAAGGPEIGAFYVAVNHGGPTLIALGTEEQKSFHLPRILSADSVWCQGFSEPGAGSDLAGLRCKGVVDGDHLVVTGQKIWTTGAQHADYQELLIRTEPGSQRHKGLTWVICDMRSAGITVRPIRCMDGTAHFCEVFYDDVRIPLSNVVGGLHNGWATAMATLGFERGTGMLADQIELARTVDRLIALARKTGQIADGAIRSDLAEVRADVMALHALGYATISRASREAVPGAEAAMAALALAETIQKVQRLGLKLTGVAGLERPADPRSLQIQYLNGFMWTIAGGTSEVRRNIIGERVLGLPKPK
jgi:alkylation response protein AidB-like acyl-CoA dehydrogenase